MTHPPDPDARRGRWRTDQRGILWANVLGGLALLIMGLWAATQYAASALGHPVALGAPWLEVFGYGLYYPWRVFQWDYYYGSYAPRTFFASYGFIYGAFFLELCLIVGLAVARARRSGAGDAYGTARWANRKDLKRAGLLAGEGIVLGATPAGRLLQHNGPEHALVFAPPRSGKGVGLVIPTLLTWPHSVVVYDIKRENWDITAGFRQRFSHVLRFEPTAAHAVKFNPLDEVRRGEHEFRDVQAIADIVVSTGQADQRQDHWERTAKALFIAASLHVLYAEEDKSLPGIANFLSDPARDQGATLTHMMSCHHLGDRPHPIVASLAREVANKAENELSGVFSTLMSFLTLYRDPIIAGNIRESEFRLRDLMQAEHPISLYLTIPASDTERVKPLIRVLINQLGRRLTESMTPDQSHYRHRLLLMLDEFPTLGRMDFFETALAYLPGYGIRAYLICQSLNQLEHHYGANNAILDTAHIRVTLGALDDRTARRISDLLGQTTQVRRQSNYAGSRLMPLLMHVMVSEQESPRPLLTPGEILNLPAEDSLVLVGGSPPVYARRVRYWQDQRFLPRAHIPPPNSREAQAQELPPTTASAWEERAPPAATDSTPTPALADTPTPAETLGGEPAVREAVHALLSEERDTPEPDPRREAERDAHEQQRQEDSDMITKRDQIRRREQRRSGQTQALARDPAGGGLPL